MATLKGILGQLADKLGPFHPELEESAQAMVKKILNDNPQVAKHFNDDALATAVIDRLRNPDTTRIAVTSPNDFRLLAAPIPEGAETGSLTKYSNLTPVSEFNSVPDLYVGDRSRGLEITGHDGRHRTMQISDRDGDPWLGTVPVVLRGEGMKDHATELLKRVTAEEPVRQEVTGELRYPYWRGVYSLPVGGLAAGATLAPSDAPALPQYAGGGVIKGAKKVADKSMTMLMEALERIKALHDPARQVTEEGVAKAVADVKSGVHPLYAAAEHTGLDVSPEARAARLDSEWPEVVWHASKSPSAIEKFVHNTHVGTRQAAEDRAVGVVNQYNDLLSFFPGESAKPPVLSVYPLRMKDASRNYLEIGPGGKDNHVWSDSLGGDVPRTPTRERYPDLDETGELSGKEWFREAKDYNPNVSTRHPLPYANAAEDVGSTSYVTSNADDLRSVHAVADPANRGTGLLMGGLGAFGLKQLLSPRPAQAATPEDVARQQSVLTDALTRRPDEQSTRRPTDNWYAQALLAENEAKKPEGLWGMITRDEGLGPTARAIEEYGPDVAKLLGSIGADAAAYGGMLLTPAAPLVPVMGLAGVGSMGMHGYNALTGREPGEMEKNIHDAVDMFSSPSYLADRVVSSVKGYARGGLVQALDARANGGLIDSHPRSGV